MSGYFSTSVLFPLIFKQLQSSSSNVLEIGCGSGDFAYALARKGLNVIAIDSDENAIRQAKARFPNRQNLKFLLGKGECLNDILGDQTFDFIISLFTAHHLEPSAFEGMRNHLADGGRIVIVDFYANKKASILSYLIDQMITSQLRELPALFRTVSDIGILPVLVFLNWRVLFALSTKGRMHIHSDLKRGLPPSLFEWREYFGKIFDGGHERVLMGSVFKYVWDNNFA